MEACAELSQFLLAPLGRCVAGNTWLYFYPRPGFCGFLVWGRPTPRDLEELVRALEVELGAPAHVSLVDARRVEGTDPEGFAVLERYVREHHEALGRAVTRLAVVRPDGLVGAITSGFFGVTPPPYPVALFEDRGEAMRWLEVSGAEAVLREIAREEERAVGSPLLRELRALLATRLDGATLATAAKALGLSARSLQRRLGDQGTTFQAELNHARVRVATRLLRDTDASLTRIAHDVGCASLASFSSLFRRAMGVAPSAWREQNRTDFKRKR